MNGMLRRTLVLALTVVFCVGVLGCSIFKDKEKEEAEAEVETAPESTWGDATTQNIMNGVTVEEEPETEVEEPTETEAPN